MPTTIQERNISRDVGVFNRIQKGEQGEASLLSQLCPSNIVLPMTYLEPQSTASPTKTSSEKQ